MKKPEKIDIEVIAYSRMKLLDFTISKTVAFLDGSV